MSDVYEPKTQREYFEELDALGKRAQYLGVKWAWLPFEPYIHLAVQFPSSTIVVVTRDEFLNSSVMRLLEKAYGPEKAWGRSSSSEGRLSLPCVSGLLSGVRGFLRRS